VASVDIKLGAPGNARLFSSPAYQWYVVGLLLLVYVLSYFDRYLLSLLVGHIKVALDLTDFQIGLLLGPAFSFFHVLVSVPLGWAADRWSRRWLLLAGIVVWCTMTTMSGFVTSFLPLLLLRFGLGIGEAVVSPCSLSIISDSFSRERRARAISLYMAGPYLGAGLAFLVGGQLVGVLEAAGPQTFLGFGPFDPWQGAFILVGAPGLIFALLMLTVMEPKREAKPKKADGVKGVGFAVYMFRRWRAFGALFAGSTCNFALSTLTFWNVPLFERVHGWDVAKIGLVTGLFYFTAGPVGTAVAMWANKFFGIAREDGAMRTLLLGLCITVPASIVYPVMPSAELAVAVMFIAFIGKSVATAGGPAALAMITPSDMRGRSVAIFNVVIMLVGPTIGPPLIGLGVDLTGDPKSIGMILSAFVLALGLPCLLIVWLGLRSYNAAAMELASAIKASEDEQAATAT